MIILRGHGYPTSCDSIILFKIKRLSYVVPQVWFFKGCFWEEEGIWGGGTAVEEQQSDESSLQDVIF